MIELINRARTDPAAEAARLGIALESGLAPGAIGDQAKQPLAPNIALTAAAHGHGLWMLASNIFSHTGASGSTPGDRLDAAGYNWSMFGENLAMRGGAGPIGDLAELIVLQHNSLFASSEHRRNLMKENYKEIGVSQDVGKFDNHNVSMITVNFGLRRGEAFLTGVIYDDLDSNRFYSVGEGAADVVVTAVGSAGAFSTKTLSTGGYALALPAGNYIVTYDRGAVQAFQTVTISDENVKRDVVDLGLDAGPLSESLAAQVGPTSAQRLIEAVQNRKLIGDDDDNILVGGDGDDWMEGGGGDDRIIGRSGDDVIFGGPGDDVIHTGEGNDYVEAGHGDDIVRSLRGDVVLRGGPGDDTILGGVGDNIVDGGGGDDRLRGGPGRDSFIFDIHDFGHDRILDFRLRSDVLDFRGSGLDLNDLQIRQIGSHTRIDVADADASIILAGVSAVTGAESLIFMF